MLAIQFVLCVLVIAAAIILADYLFLRYLLARWSDET